MREKLKQKIRVHCETKEITQRQLCKKISENTSSQISENTLSNWISGKDNAYLDKLINVMKYLQLTPEDFDKENDKKN